jgi:hypothetical protein
MRVRLKPDTYHAKLSRLQTVSAFNRTAVECGVTYKHISITKTSRHLKWGLCGWLLAVFNRHVNVTVDADAGVR